MNQKIYVYELIDFTVIIRLLFTLHLLLDVKNNSVVLWKKCIFVNNPFTF